MIELQRKIDELKQEKLSNEFKIKGNTYDYATLDSLEEAINKTNVKLTNIKSNSEENAENLIAQIDDLKEKRAKLMASHPKTLILRNEKIDELVLILEREKVEVAQKKRYKSTIEFCYPHSDGESSLKISNVNEEQLVSKYSQFYAVVNNLLQRSEKAVFTPTLSNTYSDNDKDFIYRIELVIITLIRNNYFTDDEIRINAYNYNVLINEAINEIMWLMVQLTKLANVEFLAPKIVITNDPQKPETFSLKSNTENSVIVEKLVKRTLNYEIGKYYFWAEDRINYKLNSNNNDACLSLLGYLFGFNKFKEGQEKILAHALDNVNTIGILPTGGGKSLIYLFTTIIQPKCAIVVAPITSLMDDQVYGLKNKFNFTRATKVESNNVETIGLLNYQYYYVSPERVMTKKFRSQLYQLEYKNAIDTIVLDEVHCLSEWGHDFRVPYLMLATTLKEYCANFRYLGLTATASNSVIKDIIIELELELSDIVYISNLKRDNLKFEFIKYDNKEQFERGPVDETNPKNLEPTIIFTATKKDTERVSNRIIKEHNIDARIYHGENKKHQNDFIENKFDVLAATKAFGMGIDKPNVRKTIHYGIPGSMEAFYQEAGRAGRDGNDSICQVMSIVEPENIMELENDFFNPYNSIEEIKLYSDELKFRRMWIQTLFIANDTNIIEDEINSINEIYEQIKNGQKEFVETNKAGSDVMKKLYVLHKVGVVENWDIEYSFNENKYVLKLSEDPSNIDNIRTRACTYLSKYVNVQNKIELINMRNSLPEILDIILTWNHENFTMGKIQQLKNMYEVFEQYANQDASKEIQAKFEDYFTIEKLSDIFDLTFENATLSETISRALLLNSENIDKKISQMERVLESSRSKKIYVHYNILKFLRDPNEMGKVVELFDEVDKNEIINSMEVISNAYDTVEHKEQISNLYYTLYPYEFLEVFNAQKEKCNIYQAYYLNYVNKLLER